MIRAAAEMAGTKRGDRTELGDIRKFESYPKKQTTKKLCSAQPAIEKETIMPGSSTSRESQNTSRELHGKNKKNREEKKSNEKEENLTTEQEPRNAKHKAVHESVQHT